MHLKIFLLFVSIFTLLTSSNSRDICTRHGVLRQIDSFLISQKESKQLTFDTKNLQQITKQIETNYPLFLNNLKIYAEPTFKEQNLIQYDDQINLIKVNGVAKEIDKKCELQNATLFTPRPVKDISKALEIMKSISITSIPMNVEVSRGFLHTLDGTALLPAVTTDESILKSWATTYPLLTTEGLSTGSADAQVTALCEKINNPWDLPGPAKDRWTELGKILLKNTPTVLETVNKITQTFMTKPAIKVESGSAPTSSSYPVPPALNNIFKAFTKWSVGAEWEHTSDLDINTFKNLISDISTVSSLFRPKKKVNKFSKLAPPALGVNIDSSSLPSQLSLDSDSILLEDTLFYPQKYLDTNSDSIPDLVEGSVTVELADKQDLIEIFELTPFKSGTYQLEAVFLTRGQKFSELLSSSATPKGIRCSNKNNFKICDGYTKKLVPSSYDIDPGLCVSALTGRNQDLEIKCPLTDIKNKNTDPLGIRIDCSDNFNTVIDSKQPLFITPYCDGEEGAGFEAKHFPLFLNTDCALKANYLNSKAISLYIPQLEATVEGSGVPFYPITPYENNIDLGNSTFLNTLNSIPQSSLITLLSLVGSVFVLTFLTFIAILYCCMGHDKFKEMISDRCPCPSIDFSKYNCCKNKCRKIKFKKPSCCGCCCEYEDKNNTAGMTPGPSRQTRSRKGSKQSDFENMGAHILNLIRIPSAPDDTAIELTPLNQNPNLIQSINDFKP